MSKKEKLLLKLLSGKADANFDIDDLINILLVLGFEEKRITGSHRIFGKKGVFGILNLQKTKDGKAKEYQVKQVREFLVINKIIDNE
jgi:hypothetical protein